MARAVAMVVVLATLLFTSSACSLRASRGTMPPPDANGEVDPSAVPDFIAYVGRTDRIIGWVPKSYLLEPEQRCRGPQCAPIPVYAETS